MSVRRPPLTAVHQAAVSVLQEAMARAELELRLELDGAGFGGGGRGGRGGGRSGGRGGRGRGGRGGRSRGKPATTYQPSERKAARKAARQQKKQHRVTHAESTKSANAARNNLATENESLKRQLAALQAQVSGGGATSSKAGASGRKRRKLEDGGQSDGSARERPHKEKKKKKKKAKEGATAAGGSKPPASEHELLIQREDEQIRRMNALLGKNKKKKKGKKSKRRGAPQSEDEEGDNDLGFDSDTSDEFLAELLGDLSTYKDYISKQRSGAGAADPASEAEDHNGDVEREEHQRAEEMLRRMKGDQKEDQGGGTSDENADDDPKHSEDSEDSDEDADADEDFDEESGEGEDDSGEDDDEDDDDDEEEEEDDDDDEDDGDDDDEDDDDDDDEDEEAGTKRHTSRDESSDYDSDSEDNKDEEEDEAESGDAPDAAPSAGTYVPPALRAKMGGADQPSQEEQRLRNRVRGLINRLSDNNKTAIGKEILEVFRDHPRRSVTDAVAKVILGAVSGSQNLGGVSAEYLSLYAALLCYLHVQTGGGATGAHFLEGCAMQLEKALHTDTRNAKAASNVVQMFAYFFLVEMISANLIYDLIRKFCGQLSELEVELVLLLLRTCGFKIRQDDPISLKEIILLVEKQAAAKAAGEAIQEDDTLGDNAEASQTGSTKRLEFMLSTISDLRNNRERPSDITGGLKSRAKILMDWVYSKESKGGGVDSSEYTLPVRLETLLAPESTKKGLWWMEARLERGSLRKGDKEDDEHSDGSDIGLGEPEMSADLMALARKMRMSTDVRKAVFCAVMGAEDYAEASRELARLAPQLKPPQDREIIRVIFACCTQEKSYNPYYAALLRSVCGAHGAGNHAYTLRFSFWDLLKDADGVSRQKLENAAQLLASLLLDKSPRIGWDCIKPVEWLALAEHPGQRLFLRTFCATILASARCKVAFATLRSRDDLITVQEGLSTFSHNHLPEDMSAALSTVLPAPAIMSAAA